MYQLNAASSHLLAAGDEAPGRGLGGIVNGDVKLPPAASSSSLEAVLCACCSPKIAGRD